MIIKYSTDILEKEATRGNKAYWQGHVLEEEGNWYTQTSFWQETSSGEGKRQFSEPILIAGKNIGKANETTPEKQAYSEIKSAYKKQLDKTYHKIGEKSETLPLPMLAHKYKDNKHRLTGKLYVQPKLDGGRMCFNGDVMWSRAGKLCIPQVYEHLKFDTKGRIVDGELILPPPYTFQETMSATKKYHEDTSPKLQYYLFDILDETLTFEERFIVLMSLIKEAQYYCPNLVLVPTYPVINEEDIMVFHSKFVAEGYEGTIIRMASGLYKSAHRDISLQKFKDFDDDEFLIIDIVDGVGKNYGAAKFICSTKDGKIFESDFNATMERRKEVFENKAEYIGKVITVRYQGFTDEGKPRFSKAIDPPRDADIQG